MGFWRSRAPSFFAFGVFSVSACVPGLVVVSFRSSFSLVSEDEDEDAALAMAIATFTGGFGGGVKEKSPFVLTGVVPISSQSVPMSLPLRFNKSDNDGFLFPFLLLSVPGDSVIVVVVFALETDPDELEVCAESEEENSFLLFLLSHCFTPGNVIGNFEIFPLCEDAGDGATSMYSPCDVEGVIISEGLTGAPLVNSLNLGNSLESDA